MLGSEAHAKLSRSRANTDRNKSRSEPSQEDTILGKFGRPGALTDKSSAVTGGVKAHIKYGINALMAPADYGHAMGYRAVLGEG
jgi:hypothetical protein